ncbi:carbohydrate ABC transporter permease [Clostridium caldaquaticum]|uniref:carbohydrate ABC transporter permease n=1 Tax=Clostridium caldaquaticum TaxID=2940653 RepID=UPI002077376E
MNLSVIKNASAKSKKSKFSKNTTNVNSLIMNKKLYLFVIPALIMYLLFWIFPIFKIFQYSVTDYNGFAQNYNYIGLKNYSELAKEGVLVNSISNTLIYTVLVVFLGNVISLILALILNMKIRGKGFYRSAAYIPTLFSAIVVGFIWSYVYMPDSGLIASLFKSLGINTDNLNFLGKPSSALYSIVVVDIWKNIGTTTIIYLAGLQTVPNELLEAGKIDGCSGWQLNRYVRIPLLAASVTINVALSIINGLKAFDYPFIMTNGGPGKTTNTLIYSLYKLAFTEQQFGKASALGVVAFAIIVAITAVTVIQMNKKEVSV